MKKTNEEMMEILDEVNNKLFDVYSSLADDKRVYYFPNPAKKAKRDDVKSEEPKKEEDPIEHQLDKLEIGVKILFLVFAFVGVGILILFSVIGALKELGIVK